ncbi:2'-5'-oligoadenylate synthase 3 [Orchesella cincta]|uniref:2'-5'-oligoadenylate synthase 3 n=1 Tax=Orchesella cincta TaxID=48709 RepID=A0A1D2NJN6_ORCCI|nr:2'-5'-oligoadenylate synthase 3 [Orchesella cincta]
MDALSTSSSSSSSSDWDTLPKLSVSDLLLQISLEQVPSEDHARKCQDIALSLVGILEKDMGPGLSGHVMVAGSYGKGTAIINESDYDIVIFFNELEPPFTKVLEDMERALKGNSDKFKGFKWRFRSSIHICFDVEGIRFDLTPAAQLDNNCQWNRWCCFAPSLLTPYPSQQYVKTLQRISQMKDPETTSYLYSSSLSIDAVVFVQRQNAFIHSVIRLAKHWASHVNTGRIPIRGKSLLVETVAIHASYSLSPVEMINRNLDKAFIKFLELFSDARTLRLYVFVNYQREDIPDSVFNQTPLVLDPANPYNNLLSSGNFPSLALKCFEDAAHITIQKVLGLAW